MGVVPPLSHADWLYLFDQYKLFPEYQLVNQGMGLDEFKQIFWFEYLHRMLGRFIGVAVFCAINDLFVDGARLSPKLSLTCFFSCFSGPVRV
jgi:cytochrome c oxidase assembly protein subunit 15